ncbi:hypothetical protein MSG28_015587 [Choristoneura fumiferana]|uniref:Uncharacterized protein n=1 Tax=Choristoneura fumiferana TaxID=7141 RepID=A0ACC0KAR7_CHOFU|nr:hypothetical protein MSG28_015587 [Choristoneura fumiferana]
MAEAAFSEDGKYYSAISQDGRLRIWDTETNTLKQEYTPDLHLTSPPSCVQWITVGTSAVTPQKGKRRSSVSAQETQCIALGTTSGKILIYSVAKAKVETVLEEKLGPIQDRKITCLDWTRKDGLFSCNKSNYLCHWKLDVDKRHTYSVNTDNKNKLQVWRLHSGTASMVKCLGHNASQQSILVIAETSEKTWLIEDVAPPTNGEEATPNKKKRKKSLSTSDVPTVNVPTYNFVLEDAPKMISVRVQEDTETKLKLAAGVNEAYQAGRDVARDDGRRRAAAAAVRPRDPRRAALGVPDLSSKTQVLIRGEAKRKKKSKNSTTNEINKVVSEPAKDVQYIEPMGGVEVPMEARLANLALDTADRSRGAVNQNLTKLLHPGNGPASAGARRGSADRGAAAARGGRLDLTLAQRVARDSAVEQEAVIDYNDTSDEEMEVERQSTASDASWDDDRFDGDSEEGVNRQ